MKNAVTVTLSLLAVPAMLLIRAMIDLLVAMWIWHWFWEKALGEFPGRACFLGFYCFLALFKDRSVDYNKKSAETTSERVFVIFSQVLAIPAIVWLVAWFFHKVLL